MGGHPGRFQELIAELKRRRVLRVALVYGAVAWVVVEIASVVFPALMVPSWAVRLVVALALLGFPIALVFAWAFEVGPEGVKRTAPAAEPPGPGDEGAAPARRGAGRRRAAAYLGLGLAVALAGVGAYAYFGPAGGEATGPGAAPAAHGIAVLPFDNLSPDPDNAFFADGIHEDVLTQLSRIGDLRVVSRSSVLAYRDGPRNLRAIGRTLGVSHVLEGSVRRAGDRVRITAQLIDAGADDHVWAENYDRALTAENVFEIQAGIARAIAQALEAELSPAERRRLEQAPTRSLTAYDYYLKGRDYYNRYLAEQNRDAIRLFRRAVEVDSTYALAYAGLADAYAQQVLRFDAESEWLDSAAVAAERALALDPELGEAHKARGLIYDVRGETRVALEHYRRAVALNPNYAPALINVAFVLRNLGRLDEAVEWNRRSVAVAPTRSSARYHYAITLALLGLLDEAEREVVRAIELDPQHPAHRLVFAEMRLLRQDTAAALRAAEEAVARAPDDGAVHVQAGDLAFTLGRDTVAAAYYERAMALTADEPPPLRYAFILRRRGADVRSQQILRTHLERLRALLAEDAIPTVRQHAVRYDLASVHAALGDTAEAVRWVEEAVDSGWRNVRLARLDPAFDPLRGEPRFERILSNVEAMVVEMRARVLARRGG